MESNLITVTEAAEISGYTPQHIRLLIRKEIINARRSGGVWLIDMESLNNYLAGSPKPGPKPKNIEN